MTEDKRKANTVRLDEADRQRLRDHAAALGWSVNDTLVAAVKNFLDGGIHRYRVTMADTSCVVVLAVSKSAAVQTAADLLPTSKHGSVTRVEEV